MEVVHPSVVFRRDGDKLVAQSKMEQQAGGEPVGVLHIEAGKRLAVATSKVMCARHDSLNRRGLPPKEIRDPGESEIAAGRRDGDHVALQTFELHAQRERVDALGESQLFAELEAVLGEAAGRCAVWPEDAQSGDGDRSQRLAGNEGESGRRLLRQNPLEGVGAREAEAEFIHGARGEDAGLLEGQIVRAAGEAVRKLRERFVGEKLLPGIRGGVPREEGVRAGELVVNPEVEKILPHGAVEQGHVGRDAAARRAFAGRQGPEVQIGLHLGRDRNLLISDNPLPGLQAGYEADDGLPESLPEPFVAAEKESAVFDHGSAKRGARLVPQELRAFTVKKIAGVEIIVSKEPEQGAVQRIRARLGDDVERAARGAADLRAVVVRVSAELLDGFDPAERTGSPAGHAVAQIVDDRAIEHIDVE